MTRFNPDRKHKTSQEWSQEAYKITSQNNLQFHVIGGLALSVLVAGATTPITGGLIALYTLYTAWIRSGEVQRNQSAIIDTGCIAQVLSGDYFQDYLQQVGHNVVINELNYAQQRGLTISNDALDYLEDYCCNQPTARLIQPINNQQVIGQSDRPTQTQTVEVNHDQNTIDIVGQITDRIQNIFGVGLGGSGKGMLLANAIRAVKVKHPNKKIFLINGKDDPKEHKYFTGVVDVEKRLHCETAKPSTVAVWFESAVAECDNFADENNGVLLIVDEATIIGAKLKDAKSNALNDKIVGIASSGGSIHKNIWVFAQTPFAGGNGSNLTALSQLIKVAIVKGDEIGVLDDWKRAAIFKKFDSDNVTELAANSECNRAVYWGGSATWYSMPKLENYSDYDRDTETHFNNTISVAQQLKNTFYASESFEKQSHPLTDKIITILSASENSMSLNAIRISKIWEREFNMSLPSRSDVREVVKQLIQDSIVEGNEGVGYRLTNIN